MMFITAVLLIFFFKRPQISSTIEEENRLPKNLKLHSHLCCCDVECQESVS